MCKIAGCAAVNVAPNTLDLYRFYSAIETAERFSATVQTLNVWVRHGVIHPVHLNGDSYRLEGSRQNAVSQAWENRTESNFCQNDSLYSLHASRGITLSMVLRRDTYAGRPRLVVYSSAATMAHYPARLDNTAVRCRHMSNMLSGSQGNVWPPYRVNKVQIDGNVFLCS